LLLGDPVFVKYKRAKEVTHWRRSMPKQAAAASECSSKNKIKTTFPADEQIGFVAKWQNTAAELFLIDPLLFEG